MKRLSIDEEAVSEVVGTILTLLITVALFSTVFATVQQMEGPSERISVELEADFDDSGNITIDHLGGDPLDMEELTFFLTDGEVPEENMRLSNEGEDDNIWGVSDTVLIEDYEVDGDLELMIRHDDTRRVLFQNVLLDGSRVIDIREAWIDYELDWRNHAEPGDEIEINARITAPVWKTSDSFDPENLSVNASITKRDVLLDDNDPISTEDEIQMKHVHNGNFVKSLNVSGVAEDERHRVKINAVHPDMDLNIEPKYIFLNIGKEPADYYEENLEIGNVWFDPRAPSNGDSFEIELEVFNEGERDYEAGWRVQDDRQEEMDLSGEKNISHGAAPTLITTEYPNDIKGHGAHEISIEIKTDEDDDWEGDTWNETVYVDPNILVIKDNIPRDSDEGNIMKNSLSALNLDYKITAAEDYEDTDDLEDEMAQYSVTIWMLGNYTEDVEPYLMNDDVLISLDDYVEGELEGTSINGAVWMVGSGLTHFEGDGFGELQDKLGFEGFENDDPGEFSTERTLVNPTYDKNGTYGDFEYNVSAGEYLPIDKARLKDDYVENNSLVFQEEIGDLDDYLGVGYEAGTDQRTAVNPFTFDSLQDPGQRAMIAGEVIEWLSNITSRTGVDVSVTSQTIEPKAPMYMDEITIKSTLRNNGPEDLTVGVRAVRNRGEEILTPEGEDTVHLEKNGGTATVTFTWTADELGRHEFLVTADYYNEIDEVNEINNDIRYKDLEVTEDDTEANVQFSTLLVDADGSEYDDEDYNNVTGEIKESFDRFGYGPDVHYDYHSVFEDENDPVYPEYDEMQDYNSIFWVTGERDESELFTEDSINNILEYLEQDEGANMLFMGEHILDNLNNSKLRDYMGVGTPPEEKNTDHLLGQKNTAGHGLNYEVEDGDYPTFETNEDGEAIFEDSEENIFASSYDDGSTRTVYMGVNLDRINGTLAGEENFADWPMGSVNTSRENAREELIYTSLWNFGKRDERSELRVSDYDIKFSSDNPQTGRSYQIEARIENTGYTGTSALVRVREGENHIASQTAFVEGSERNSVEGSSYFEVSPGSTTIEVTWDPMEGGMRPIRVRVDPLRDVDEIEPDGEEGLDDKIMEFNNQARVVHPVYYFYDDMESGESKWSHDSTMMNIDGSSALDFMGRSDLNSNVKDDWDWNYSGSTTSGAEGDIKTYSGEGEGVYNTRDPDVNEFTDNASYSPPKSYWMAEGVGDPEGRDRKPLDMVLVFDRAIDSQEDYEDAVAAAEAAIDFLRPGDRVGIVSSTGADVSVDLSLTDGEISENSEETDKQDIKDQIPDYDGGLPQKAILASASMAIQQLDDDGRPEATEGIITFTDGLSTQDAGTDYTYTQGEGAGDEPDERGAVQWYNRTDPDEKGLLGIPYNIMTLTISDKIESRHHWISATSTADVSYGILERETEKLKNLYEMFVLELIESERGDLRSIPQENPSLNDDKKSSSSSLLSRNEPVRNAQFFVFADAFTTGHFDSEVDYYDWKNGRKVPGYGVYDVFDFQIVEGGGKIGRGTDDWIWVESDTTGDKLAHTVHPRDTLDELEGEYEVKGAYANFYISTEGDSSAELRITQNGQTFVETGITEDYTTQATPNQSPNQGPPGGEGSYINIPIEGISNPEEFDFELIHEGPNGDNLIIDDLSFTYEIDYYPEDHEYDQEV
ncbi:MAG: CARDB domain-containing protein, partial [Thermoplasmata archaeon]